MLRNRILVVKTIFLLLLPFMSGNVIAAEPTLHEVYQAARAGKYAEADDMMRQVLANHPDSAKAHFVEAELMAKEGRLPEATSELATAERLKPGLPFAKPAAIEALRARLDPAYRGVGRVVPNAAVSHSGFPWVVFLLVAGMVAIVVIAIRMLRQRPQIVQAPNPGAGASTFPYGGAGVGQVGPTTGGMGSTLLGGLATGAAVGAGMVAGEALMHRILDDRPTDGMAVPPEPVSENSDPSYDMGGDDFGISDGSSWDDTSDSGGGDWGSDWD